MPICVAACERNSMCLQTRHRSGSDSVRISAPSGLHYLRIALQRHFSAMAKFAHVESRFCGHRRRGKAAFDVPVNPCVRSVCSRSVVVGLYTTKIECIVDLRQAERHWFGRRNTAWPRTRDVPAPPGRAPRRHITRSPPPGKKLDGPKDPLRRSSICGSQWHW